MMMIVKVVLFLVGLLAFVSGCEMLLKSKIGIQQVTSLTVFALGGILISSAFILEAIDQVRKSVEKIGKLIRDHRDKLDRAKLDESDGEP